MKHQRHTRQSQAPSCTVRRSTRSSTVHWHPGSRILRRSAKTKDTDGEVLDTSTVHRDRCTRLSPFFAAQTGRSRPEAGQTDRLTEDVHLLATIVHATESGPISYGEIRLSGVELVFVGPVRSLDPDPRTTTETSPDPSGRRDGRSSIWPEQASVKVNPRNGSSVEDACRVWHVDW